MLPLNMVTSFGDATKRGLAHWRGRSSLTESKPGCLFWSKRNTQLSLMDYFYTIQPLLVTQGWEAWELIKLWFSSNHQNKSQGQQKSVLQWDFNPSLGLWMYFSAPYSAMNNQYWLLQHIKQPLKIWGGWLRWTSLIFEGTLRIKTTLG